MEEEEVFNLEEEHSRQSHQPVQDPRRSVPCVFLRNSQETSIAKAE